MKKIDYYGIQQHLKSPPSGWSDKEGNVHQYGMFYEFFFNALMLKKGRKLRLLELGVSMFGEGSLNLFSQMPCFEQVVGIDIEQYRATLPNALFHKLDAYDEATIDYLDSEYPNGFDCIIDDALHDKENQLYVLSNYTRLISDGYIIIEDVYSC